MLKAENDSNGRYSLSFYSLDNNPPDIEGPIEVNATLGEQLLITISATDPDNDTVSLSIEDSPEGSTFDNVSGIFNWTVQNVTNLTIQFMATDSKGAASLFEIAVNLCKCRFSEQCDFSEYVGDSSGPIRVVGCNCSEQYTGDFCWTEVDPCSDDPCYEGLNCTAKKDPFGFACDSCPVGLAGDGETCYGKLAL